MKINLRKLKFDIRNLQEQGKLDKEFIQLSNKRLLADGYDIQIRYFEIQHPYYITYCEFVNLADLPQIERKNSRKDMGLNNVNQPIILKNKRMVVKQNFKDLKDGFCIFVITITSGVMAALLGPSKPVKIYEKVNVRGGSAEERPSDRDQAAAKAQIKEALRKDREARTQAKLEARRKDKKAKEIIGQNLDPVAIALEHDRETSKLAQSITNPQPSIGDLVQDQLASEQQDLIERWLQKLIQNQPMNNMNNDRHKTSTESSKDSKSSKSSLFVEGFTPPQASRKPPRIGTVCFGSNTQLQKRIAALQRLQAHGIDQSYEEWFDGASKRRKGKIEPSKSDLLTPKYGYSRVQAEKKSQKHLKKLCLLYGIPYDENWSAEKKTNLYIEIIEKRVIGSPNLFVRKDGSFAREENAEHYLDQDTGVAASFTYHPDDPLQEKFLISSYPIPDDEIANVTDPTLNGNIGQSREWHNKRKSEKNDRQARKARENSLKTKFYQTLSPEAKMSSSQRRRAQQVSDDRFGSCQPLTREEDQLLKRAKKFDSEKAEFRKRYGYTGELWSGEFDQNTQEANQINDF